MDPLTHTLVGANLASTRLGRVSRLAPAALVIGANIPDVDVLAYGMGDDFAIGFRRGWTHGLPAQLILPIILTGILLLWARLRRREQGPPARAWRLLGVSVLAVLTHPALDWLNNYGMRWLMPFDRTWFYGDSVFIMDPWLWLILGFAWLYGRKATIPLLSAWLVFFAAIGMVVSQRAPIYLLVVGVIATALLIALFRRPTDDDPDLERHRLGVAGLSLALLFIIGMISVHALTLERVIDQARDQRVGEIERIMVGPVPMDPTTWDVLVQTDSVYRWGVFRWRDGGLQLRPESLPVPKSSREWDAIRSDPTIAGFMTWVRFPWYEIESTEHGRRAHVMDARYTRSRTRGFGSAVVDLD